MNRDAVQQVLVLGGGSAGWLTACLLAAVHGPHGVQVTLVESDEAPPIGVGEGTWPSMRDTLRRIGLDETELIRRCQVAFKQGSRFDGWAGRPLGPEGDRYQHPFTLPLGHGDVPLVAGSRSGPAGQAFGDTVCPQPAVVRAGLAPKQVQTPAYAAVTNYAYHFDAGLFGSLLREHGVQRLGVRHVLDHVEAVQPDDAGGIAALRTRRHGDLAADLFVDCSGLAARLIGQHHGVPLLGQREVLFNDAALAVQVPYTQADAPIASCTIATAWAKGWIWDIGLPSRRGVGVVFSRAHASEDEAAAALQAYLDRSGAPAERATPRRILYEPGYRERFWVGNCVAVGLSSGFIEPLEASALALVELSAQRLCDELPMPRASMGAVARRFNDDFRYRWARVIDFLKLHYVLSERDDSDYWRAHRDPSSWPERLRELLPMWRLRPPARHDFGRLDEVFPSASYQYVLYGMGFQPAPSTLSAAEAHAVQAHFEEVQRQGRRLLGGLPGHRALLEHIQQHGQGG